MLYKFFLIILIMLGAAFKVLDSRQGLPVDASADVRFIEKLDKENEIAREQEAPPVGCGDIALAVAASVPRRFAAMQIGDGGAVVTHDQVNHKLDNLTCRDMPLPPDLSDPDGAKEIIKVLGEILKKKFFFCSC